MLFLKNLFNKPLAGFLGGLLVFVLGWDAAVLADNGPLVQDDLQTWRSSEFRRHLTRRVHAYMDAQTNVADMTGKPDQYNGKTHSGQILLRPALGYQLTKSVSLWSSYGWTPSFQPQ